MNISDVNVLDPFAERMKTFVLYGVLVGLFFGAIYPTLNWLSEYRNISYTFHSAAELTIPFVPGAIWIYLSLYALFLAPPICVNSTNLIKLAKMLVLSTVISGLVYLLFPAKLGFERVLPTDLTYKDMYEKLFFLAKPYNTAPSLHVDYAASISMVIVQSVRHIITKAFFILWTAALSVSTILVHQHHLIDVVSAFLLAGASFYFVERKHA